jgi:RHS repeat-associated protein
VVNASQPETTYYVYGAGGQRAHKIIERNSKRQAERFYFGGFEIYREYGSGNAVTLERETLHVVDDKQRIVLVETETINKGARIAAPAAAQRYQLGNHLGSASLELDEAGGLISYEEYGPYGTTAYQAGRSAAEVSLKRYRYTGKERDEENGFAYHGARYYASWLRRWTSCDPEGLVAGTNLYAYVNANPLRLVDPSGRGPVTDNYDQENLVCGVGAAIKGGISAPPPPDVTKSISIPAIELPSDNVLVRSTGHPLPATGSPVATHVYVDPDPMTHGMRPKNPASLATPADHALGNLGRVVEETRDGVQYRYILQDSPYIATTRNVEQACLSPQGLGYNGPQYLIDADKLPSGTALIDNPDLIENVRQHALENPSQQHRAGTWNKLQPVEQEAVIRGYTPTEALTPVSDARVTLQGQIVSAPSAWARVRSFVKGAVIGYITNRISTEILFRGHDEISAKGRESASLALSVLPPGGDILIAAETRLVVEGIMNWYEEASRHVYERFIDANPNANRNDYNGLYGDFGFDFRK